MAGSSEDGRRRPARRAARRGARRRARLRRGALAEQPFVPGETTVPVAAKVIGAPELEALVDASLDGWLTEGRFAQRFAPAFARCGRARARAARRARARRPTCWPWPRPCSHLHERPLAPGRRGGHPGARLLDDRQPALPAGPRARLRGRGAGHAQPDARGVRRRDRRPHARRHGRPLPRQPVRRRRTGRAVRRARPRADRGLLRRARLDPRRPRRRHLRRRRPPTRSIRPTT